MEQIHLMFNPKQSIIIYDFAIYSTKKTDDADTMRCDAGAHSAYTRECSRWEKWCGGNESRPMFWLSASSTKLTTTCICMYVSYLRIISQWDWCCHHLKWCAIQSPIHCPSIALFVFLVVARSNNVHTHTHTTCLSILRFILSSDSSFSLLLIWAERQEHSIRDLSVSLCVVCTCQVWCCRYKTTIIFVG